MHEMLNTLPACEIVTTRKLHAACDLVFKAWTDPLHLKNWWGPKGFTNTFHEFDLRPGGKWSFTMHGPDKGNYPNDCEFIEIAPLQLVSWHHHSNPRFRVVVAFKRVAEEVTTLTFKMIFDTAEDCSKVKAFAVEKNEENLDRLEAELRKMTNG